MEQILCDQCKKPIDTKKEDYVIITTSTVHPHKPSDYTTEHYHYDKNCRGENDD